MKDIDSEEEEEIPKKTPAMKTPAFKGKYIQFSLIKINRNTNLGTTKEDSSL